MSEFVTHPEDTPDRSLPSFQEQVRSLKEIQASHGKRLGELALDLKAQRLLSVEELRKVSVPDSLLRSFAYLRLVPSPHQMPRNIVVTEFGICLQPLSPRYDMAHYQMPTAYVPLLERDNRGNYSVAACWGDARPFSAEETEAVRQMGEELELAKITGVIPSLNAVSGVEISHGK